MWQRGQKQGRKLKTREENGQVNLFTIEKAVASWSHKISVWKLIEKKYPIFNSGQIPRTCNNYLTWLCLEHTYLKHTQRRLWFRESKAWKSEHKYFLKFSCWSSFLTHRFRESKSWWSRYLNISLMWIINWRGTIPGQAIEDTSEWKIPGFLDLRLSLGQLTAFVSSWSSSRILSDEPSSRWSSFFTFLSSLCFLVRSSVFSSITLPSPLFLSLISSICFCFKVSFSVRSF